MGSDIERSPGAPEYLERVRALVEPIRAAAAEIEAARQLPAEIAELLQVAGMFSVAVPKAFGGLELDPLTHIEAIELLATADASAAWCAMIGCDTGYIGAFLEDATARNLIVDPTRASAFVANPTGFATPVEGGYTVTGRWTFASGSTHSALFALGCLVPGENGPRMANERTPEVRVVVMPSSEASVVDTWTTTGVRGSGSHDIAVENVFVPECNTFTLMPARMTRPEPLYRFPMLFTFKLGAVALGCARGAIDDVIAIAATKGSFGTRAKIGEQEWLHEAVARAEMTLAQARAFYYEATEQAWREMLAGDHPTPRTHARLNLAQIGAIERCVEVVDAMYRAGGSASLYAKNTLDRRLRDIHTMAQHTVVSHRSIVESGRMLLGL
ncbi:MAG: acyl-CoA dehydrogenase family protein [Dehalococcoidia bacterium]